MELIGHWSNPTLTDGTVYIHSTQSLTMGFLDLQYHKQLFIHAPGLPCDTSTMDLKGSTDIVRRVLVGGSAQGDVVNDALGTSLQAITFSSEAVLHRMHFQIKGWSGKTLGMSNHQISWEICLVPPGEK